MVRLHMKEVLVGVLRKPDSTALEMARAETFRLIGAVLTCLNAHPLSKEGWCPACDSADCGLRRDVRLALLPFDHVVDQAGRHRLSS
ncbi:hypothetical protein ACFFSW_34505 [Saccharothrix longispora]|uniref:Uncharacterized protein n=1 Tax=Saccharothrix longispora TaxID=33920 RepID=A0ABU1PNI8_9PSEU|nr:hypothetical protein [Saccharothrix longispora]MDR6591639.1 hypothetical protein [Saccharothrix longispora]